LLWGFVFGREMHVRRGLFLFLFFYGETGSSGMDDSAECEHERSSGAASGMREHFSLHLHISFFSYLPSSLPPSLLSPSPSLFSAR
jgi:hypothetical protein